MEAALAASAAEFERAKRLADMELAEVEAAIAASLALERERLEKLKALAAKEAAAAAAATSAADSKEAEGDGKAQEEAAAPEPDVATRMLLEAPDATSAATAAHAQKGVKPEEAPSSSDAAAPSPSPAPAPAAAEGKSEDKPYDPFADTPDMGGFGSAGTGGSLPPLRPTGSMGLSKLPDILKGAHANVAASEEGLAAVKKERAALRASAEADAASLDAATQAKLAERAAHLRRQRDLILAKRKAEREEKLAQFKASGKPGVDAGTKSRVAAAVASMPSGAEAAPPTSLTASLAEKVRSDYLTSEERRKLAAKQASHVSLQERLASVKQAQERTAAAQAKAMQSLRQVAASRAAAVMSTSPGR
ncbi:unnamed protein product [Symbiodinium sp. KB8]|nr:unnamed protein product [Symbiodinium sp. KB8]